MRILIGVALAAAVTACAGENSGAPTSEPAPTVRSAPAPKGIDTATIDKSARVQYSGWSYFSKEP